MGHSHKTRFWTAANPRRCICVQIVRRRASPVRDSSRRIMDGRLAGVARSRGNDVTESSAALRPDHTRMLDALTGIRALAALWVVTYHYKGQLNALLPITKGIDPLVHSGYMGVDLFFSLSGFILAYRYLHRFGAALKWIDYRRFLWLRLARVWPVQFLTLNLFVLMLFAGRAAGVHLNLVGLRTSPLAYVENILLVQAWFGEALSMNNPAWSVSAEWFIYLLFPLLAAVFVRFRSIGASLFGAAVCYAALLAACVLQWHDPGTINALLRVVLEFSGGCFLFMIWTRAGHSRWWGTGAIFAFLAIIAGSWTLGTEGLHGVVLSPLLGALILCLASGRGVLARFFSTRALVFGGEVSYSLYMTHALVQPMANRVFPPEDYTQRGLGVRLAVGLVVVVMIAAPAVGTYLLVEKPARRYLRGKLKREDDQVDLPHDAESHVLR